MPRSPEATPSKCCRTLEPQDRSTRAVLLPSPLLAALKARANRELDELNGRGAVCHRYGLVDWGGRQDAQQAESGAHGARQETSGAAAAGNGVAWVSTNNAMVARVVQVGGDGSGGSVAVCSGRCSCASGRSGHPV